MNKMLRKMLSALQVGAIVTLAVLTSTTAAFTDSNVSSGMWLKGDFHTHTYLSDGSYKASEVAAKSEAIWIRLV